MTDSPLGTRTIPVTEGRHVALPLGGIGTGNVSVCADGALRQWQLHNIGNHQGDLPGSTFMIRAGCVEPPVDVRRVLQAPPPGAEHSPTPLVTDDHVPEWQRAMLQRHRGVDSCDFTGLYPRAHIDHRDEELPVEVSMDAFTPLVPLDTDRSSLPVAMITFTIANRLDLDVHGWLTGSLLNAVGWDGTSTIDGVRGVGLGGNTNRVERSGDWSRVLLENHSLPFDHPGAGSMVLATDQPHAAVLPTATTVDEVADFLDSRAWGHVDRARGAQPDSHPSARPAAGPSPDGQTWLAALAARFDLAPGESTTIRFLISWHFPNRYVNFEQFGPTPAQWGPSKFWLGNAYTQAFTDAADVARRVETEWEELESATDNWLDVWRESSLSEVAREHLAAQAAFVRSPTCFRSASGEFFGFEGVLGASTMMWSSRFGGSCPLNCTHVWNYAQTVSALFPELEQEMRRIEFEVMQHPSGYLPHRLIAPTWLPQLWEVPIGGPETPALDGMLGCVLKTWREARRAAGTDWVRRWWPQLVRMMTHVESTWDPDGTGMLHGIQPSTHDIDLSGLNTFMGTYWLGAVRAMTEMARLLDDQAAVRHWTAVFDRGSAAYDEALFNGSYYRQVLEEGDPVDFQWVDGVLADQLVGQWWADQLELGPLLPPEHVHSSLQAVLQHNLKEGFDGFEHGYRVFADQDDTGLLMCSWPSGGRPEVPTRYADEVWTGSEYQVAAHCLEHGLDAEAERILAGLWARYDGSRRNPYNQVECGDHYVRAMAGWSVLEAYAGIRHDACTGTLTVLDRPDGCWPLLTGTGWGTLRRSGTTVTLTAAFGELAFDAVRGAGEPVRAEIRLGAGQSWSGEVLAAE